MKDVIEDVDRWVARRRAGRDRHHHRHAPLGAAPARARRWRSTIAARSRAWSPAAASRARSSRSPTRSSTAAVAPAADVRHRRRGGLGRRACPAAARSTSAWSASSRERPGGVRTDRARGRPRRARHRHPAASTSARSCSCAPTAPRRARSATPSSTPRARPTPRSSCGPTAPRSGATSSSTSPRPTRGSSSSAPSSTPSTCRRSRARAGWRPYVVDPRARFATPERFPDALGVVAGWPEEAFEELGAPDKATYIVILTHDPKLDDATLLIALRHRRRPTSARWDPSARRPTAASGSWRGRDRGGPGADQRAGRPRPRRHERARDGAVDHGRAAPRCATGARAAGCATQGQAERIHADAKAKA